MSSAAVICRAADARACALMLAAPLATARQGAIAAIWAPGVPALAPGMPGLPAARSLVRRLAARGIEASAAGACALIVLPGSPRAAAHAAARLPGAGGGAAVVVAVGGARTTEIDGLLAIQDRLFVALPDGPAALLAAGGLAALGPPVESVRPPEGLLRWRAAAGFGGAARAA